MQTVIPSPPTPHPHMCVPRNVGVSGNERADRLANLAPIAGGTAIDLAILNTTSQKKSQGF